MADHEHEDDDQADLGQEDLSLPSRVSEAMGAPGVSADAAAAGREECQLAQGQRVQSDEDNEGKEPVHQEVQPATIQLDVVGVFPMRDR